MKNSIYDIAIIGAGPAGMTAAIYAGRANKSAAMIDKEGFGGQIAKSPKVENIPGFQSISGADFAAKAFEQAVSLPTVEHIMEEVSLVRYGRGLFTIYFSTGAFICSKSVICATGCKPKELKLDTKNVYYCVTCDGPFFKKENVLVVGSGNTGAAFALELATYCKRVYVCDVRMELGCEAATADKIKKNKKITFLPNCSVKAVRNGEDGALEAVITSTGNEIPVKAIFGAVGMTPQTRLMSPLAKLDAAGYIIADDCEIGAIPGLFAAGDCRQKELHQVATSASDGAIAATKAIRFLNK